MSEINDCLIRYFLTCFCFSFHYWSPGPETRSRWDAGNVAGGLVRLSADLPRLSAVQVARQRGKDDADMPDGPAVRAVLLRVPALRDLQEQALVAASVMQPAIMAFSALLMALLLIPVISITMV